MLTDQSPKSAVVIACDLTAIPADQRAGHESLAASVLAAVKELQALPNGYAFRLPTDSPMLLKAAEFIAYERLCCPFFAFHIEVEPHGGAIWVGLSGVEGVKAFVIAELGGQGSCEETDRALDDLIGQAEQHGHSDGETGPSIRPA